MYKYCSVVENIKTTLCTIRKFSGHFDKKYSCNFNSVYHFIVLKCTNF